VAYKPQAGLIYITNEFFLPSPLDQFFLKISISYPNPAFFLDQPFYGCSANVLVYRDESGDLLVLPCCPVIVVRSLALVILELEAFQLLKENRRWEFQPFFPPYTLTMSSWVLRQVVQSTDI
jgi:hypothetical protein